MKNKTKIIIIVSVTFLLLIIGVAYAYFSATITGDESSQTLTVSGGTLTITYDGGANISASGLQPQSEAVATKTFTITGNDTANLIMPYSVALVIDTNTLTSGALKYTLTSTNTSNNGIVVPSITTKTDIPTGTNTIALGDGDFTTGTNNIHTYVLNIYFPDTGASQNENQGKSFAAHISVTSSSSSEKLATLILSDNGGADTIEAKGSPNLNVTSPLASYTDNVFTNSESSYSITTTRYVTYADSYTFNTSTGTYTLVNPSYGVYSTIYSSLNGKYIVSYSGSTSAALAAYTNLSTIYKVTANTTSTKIYYIASSKTTNYNYSETGMYATTDDYGTSYYYRGAVNNNWVHFAGYYWRIIRINGDGTVRMIYSGSTAPTSGTSIVMTGTGTQLGTYPFYNSYSNNMNVGYMATINEVHGLTNDSYMKYVLTNWYTSNLTNYSTYLADAILCNDRTPYTDAAGTTSGGGTGTTLTYYGGYIRLVTNKNPILTCSTQSDAFTVDDTTNGNGALTYPIGVITADEIAYAGGSYGTSNTLYYLYTAQSYWSMTPSYFTGSIAQGFYTNGNILYGSVYGSYGARPVISLSTAAIATGSGTYDDPYIIQ